MHSKWWVTILFAGASKSHISQKMVDDGYTSISFVWPTNRLSERSITRFLIKIYLSCFTTLSSLSINSFVFEAGTCDARPAVSLQTSYPLCNRPKYSKKHTKTQKKHGPSQRSSLFFLVFDLHRSGSVPASRWSTSTKLHWAASGHRSLSLNDPMHLFLVAYCFY